MEIQTSVRERAKGVLSLMQDGMYERQACESVGISTNMFRGTILKNRMDEDYALAQSFMAQAQVNHLEDTIQDMRDEKIDAKTAKVEIDARKWLASKYDSSRFGDRTAIDVTAKMEQYSEEELNAEIQRLTSQQATTVAVIEGEAAKVV